MEKLERVSSYITGLRRGYVYVACRGVESDLQPIPETLKGLRGNLRWALERFKQEGCTAYSKADFQDGYSNRFCYSKYYGYKEEC